MKRKKIIYSLGIITIVAISLIGASFALWTQNFTQSGENIVNSDCFQIILKEEKGITLENSFPMYDKDGKKLAPYTFQISNTCDRQVEYQLNFETTNNTTLSDDYVKFMFQENEPTLLSGMKETSVTISNGKDAYVLESGIFPGKTTKDYSIRLWIDENVTQNNIDAMNKYFEGKITIYASYITKYIEPNLNGTDPVLKDGLIPVTIDNDGTVHKADINKEWYNYKDKQEWANAVILEDENMVYRDGQIIPESNIESYFVWIPRYKYKIWNLGLYEGLSTSVDYNQVHPIEIVFGTDTTEDTDLSCKTPMLSGESGTCKEGKYMTHPAFIAFDTEDNITKGIWVGKFETGYKGATSTTEAEKNINDSIMIQIKPNVYSWRGIQVANAYLSSFNYKREYDSHMMKNTEWGAVAYLQHSEYGSQESVRINNNSAFITGYGGVVEPTCGYIAANEDCNKYEAIEKEKDGSYTVNYFNSLSVSASTTNNYSGVYDMSGGAWEYVMGVMLDSIDIATASPCSGRDETYNSGFNGTYCYVNDSLTIGVVFPTDKRYYDMYEYGTVDEGYNRRILGDATGEIGPFFNRIYSNNERRQIGSWDADEAWFVWSRIPWFERSASYAHGSGAGVFAFSQDFGSVHRNNSFRVVLVV